MCLEVTWSGGAVASVYYKFFSVVYWILCTKHKQSTESNYSHVAAFRLFILSLRLEQKLREGKAVTSTKDVLTSPLWEYTTETAGTVWLLFHCASGGLVNKCSHNWNCIRLRSRHIRLQRVLSIHLPYLATARTIYLALIQLCFVVAWWYHSHLLLQQFFILNWNFYQILQN